MAAKLETKLDGVVLLEPQVHGDERGFMVETFRRDAWAELGIDVEFVQHNHSRSAKDTLRGIHFQTEPGQAKLVRCPRGAIFDVAVDLRRDSPTYGQWEGHVLDDESHRQLFVPVGFGHGFAVPQRRRRRHLPALQPLRPGDRGRHRLGRPRRRASSGRSTEPLLSERDKSAPRWPRWPSRCRSRARVRPAGHRGSTSASPPPRQAGR